MKKAIGIDIGGTKIAVASISQDGKLTERTELPSQTKDGAAMFNSVVETVERFFEKSQTTLADYSGIGVGIPGKVNLEKGVAIFQNNLPWPNFPIVQRLKEVFPIEVIHIDNDVYQAAFAEWSVAKMAPEDLFVYYTISTGIACSIIQNGSFIRGSGFAGEAGLLQVIDPSSGGKVERLEALASGPALERKAQALYQEESVSTKELFARYHTGDTIAVKIVEEMIDSLTHSIYGLICLVDPKKNVFGGSISLYQPFIIEKVKERLEKYVISAQESAISRLVVSPLENNAGIIGAGLQVFK